MPRGGGVLEGRGGAKTVWGCWGGVVPAGSVAGSGMPHAGLGCVPAKAGGDSPEASEARRQSPVTG